MNTLNTLYKAAQVAEILEMTPEAVYKYIKQGRLKSIRQGRLLFVTHADLHQFLQEETAPISAKPQLRK